MIMYAVMIAAPATTNARTGAIRPGMITLLSSPSPLIALAPSAANAAPTSPPISACDEEDGRPKYHVARFQAMAPIRPANTTVIVTAPLSTMSWPTVAATLSERNAPMKLKIAAKMTATRGGIARVEIDAATTFAVSWNPLVKSNASAVATTMTRMMSADIDGSGVLDDDA